MRSNFDGRRDVWGPLLALHLRAWSETIFRPAAKLRQYGLFRPSQIGVPPPECRFTGGGAIISKAGGGLNLLNTLPDSYARLKQFDIAASEYRSIVEPFSAPIYQEVLKLLRPYLVPDARLLDVGCGPGTEAVALAREVPLGEVIACDLSTEMVKQARQTCLHAKLTNTACYQCDASNLPSDWSERFDAILCMLSFHFFPDAEAVLQEFFRVLAPRGKVFIVEPGAELFKTIATPLLELANTAFVKYRTGHEFIELLNNAGFSQSYWTEVLPGMGVAIGTRHAPQS